METLEDCKSGFSIFEIRRFLDQNTFRAWDDLRTRNELMRVELEGSLPGLMICPECKLYAVELEGIRRRLLVLFYCRRQECQAVTCLECNSPQHRGRSCEGNNAMTYGYTDIRNAQRTSWTA
jgi:hypothetical protein